MSSKNYSDEISNHANTPGIGCKTLVGAAFLEFI